MSAGQINTTARPHAERIVEGDSWHVQLDLDAVADTLLDQIGAVLYRQRLTWMLSMVGNPRTMPADKASMRRALREALIAVRAFDVPIYGPQADELQADLFEASVEPPRCEGRCGGWNFAVRDDGLCEADGAAADFREADFAQIRAVGS